MMRLLRCASLLGLLLILPILASAAPDDNRPNILVIVADDMGFTDIGSFGGEIATPSLDRLATKGVRLNNFHVLPSCAPTRAVLLSGVDNHIAGMGAQIIAPGQVGKPGYEGHLNDRVVTSAEVLADAGYHTYHSGKWHLGMEPKDGPYARGFQQTYGLISGAASHFSDGMAIIPEEPVIYRRNGVDIEQLPEDFYSTKNYTDELLSWMEKDSESGKPFFAYLAYTAPHDPLHAPREYIDKYRGKYNKGFEALRESRFEGLKAQGIINADAELPEWPLIVKGWHKLTAEEQANRSRDMEVYAAMVDVMDEEIGRVYQWLENSGKLENTVIVFLSDNGANAYKWSAYPSEHPEYFDEFDNSFENRGASKSFVSMEAGWAAASNAGLRLFKSFSTEGGIRTPAIIKFPASLAHSSNSTGGVDSSFVHVRDLMPTFLELAGAAHPSENNSSLATMEGLSLVSLLKGEEPEPRVASEIGYELHATRAYFKGDWKVLQMPVPMGSGQWELYNLKSDPSETNNLAASHSEKLAELVNEHEVYEERVGVVYEIYPTLKPFGYAEAIAKALAAFIFIWMAISLLRGDRVLGYLLTLAEVVGVSLLYWGVYESGVWLLAACAVVELVRRFRSDMGWMRKCLPLIGVLALALSFSLRSGLILYLAL